MAFGIFCLQGLWLMYVMRCDAWDTRISIGTLVHWYIGAFFLFYGVWNGVLYSA